MSETSKGLDPEGLASFEAGGKRYTAFFGFRAMKAVETHYGLPFFEALQRAMPTLSAEDADDWAKVAAAGAKMRMTEVGRLFEFALLKHHPDIAEAEIDDLIDEIGLDRAGAVLGEAVAAALVKEAGEPGSTANPPARRGRRKK